MSVRWKRFVDFAKKSDRVLRLADRMGRGTGRFRILDRLKSPARPRLKPDLRQWAEQSLAAAWVGHATLLLRVQGMTILTDPVFSSRVGLGLGLMTGGPMRHIGPALSMAELPPIDLLLISHAHFDHLDRPTLRKLPKNIPVVTAHHTADLIRDLGFASVTELNWGESTRVGHLSIQAVPVRHWGARTFLDRHRGYNAYLLQSEDYRVLYGGDSAYQEEFKAIEGVDLAIVGIGAYDPYIAAHATPEQAWEMAKHTGARFVLPMHHSTFRLSHEPMTEPIERMLAAAGDESDRIVIREVGGQWTLPIDAAVVTTGGETRLKM